MQNPKSISQSYFGLLLTRLEENGLLESPGKLFNMIESGVQLNSKAHQVLATKDSKNVSTVASTEKGETITVVACCNAEGNFLPPACIMKGKNKKPDLQDGLPPGSILYMNPKSAYMNSDIFLKWMRDVFVRRKPAGKVLLLLDCHTSHSSSVEMLEFAEANDIILMSLPSHTTHCLQPLDRSVFKPFKGYFYEICRSWTRTDSQRRITRYHFEEVFRQAWAKTVVPENAISGFRATGLFPYNPGAIPEYTCEIHESNIQKKHEVIANSQNKTNSNQQTIDEPQAGPSHSLEEEQDKSTCHEAVESFSDIDMLAVELNHTKGERQPSTSHAEKQEEKETPGKILENISKVPKLTVERAKKRAKSVACLLTSPEHI
ncbi:hypothetical protein Zmor_021780 [Zophobas morio]|uniref:DDE-1 domain-containing protein n=1 Tax=Zophobas morio TaxID=2755281 RepID=A0AA38I6D3_9CUCU|nr:hypothetical protein Zmor_021780 [Zophobas morio]